MGLDINCGVRLIRTSLTENEIKPKLIELIEQLFNSIPSGVHTKESGMQLTHSQLDEIIVQGVKWLKM